MPLLLPAALADALWAHALRDAPCECVGLLGGVRREGSAGGAARRMDSGPARGDGSDDALIEARTLYPLPNIAAFPEREYVADPGHLLRALRAMERENLSLVALYHSHPGGPAYPSRTDVQLAAYPVPYLIADLKGRTLRAFRLPEGTPVEVKTE